MDVLIILVFVSLVLVAGSIVLFLFAMRQHDFEHGDRLSLLPIQGGNGPREDADNAADGTASINVSSESTRS